MEHEPASQQEEDQVHSQATQSPPSPLPNEEGTEQREANENKSGPGGGSQTPPETTWQRFKIWIWPMKFSDVLMILLTVCIATGTIASAIAIGFQWYEMHTGGADTHAIAEAAKQQVCAANRFAASADSINRGVTDAVTKLNLQARATRTLAETANSSLVQVQRAVMAISSVDVSREGGGADGKVANVVFFVRWKNVGSTPTKYLKFRHNSFHDSKRFPDNFAYSDIPDPPNTSSNTPSFAAPQGIVTANPIKIPIELAQQIVSGQQVLTLWGHAEYRDVFTRTKPHTSEYCFIITGFYGNIYSMNPADITLPIAENCKTHNCHDEECQAN